MDGKREIWKSLHTSDSEEAKLQSLRVGQEIERCLQTLRRRASALQTDPEALGRLHESRALADDAESGGPPDSCPTTSFWTLNLMH